MIVDLLAPILGLAWGAFVAMPIARRARRVVPAQRVEELRPDSRARPPSRTAANRLGARLIRRLPGIRGVAFTGFFRRSSVRRVLRSLATRRRDQRTAAQLGHELPVVIDLLAVAVAAGCTPYLSVVLAARWCPTRSAQHLGAVRRACDLGAGFADALDTLARDEGQFAGLVDALLVSDRFGAPVGPALSRLATEQRASLRRHAEARARTVPVRLLFPLVFLVLPAFGLLTVAPAVLIGFGRV